MKFVRGVAEVGAAGVAGIFNCNPNTASQAAANALDNSWASVMAQLFKTDVLPGFAKEAGLKEPIEEEKTDQKQREKISPSKGTERVSKQPRKKVFVKKEAIRSCEKESENELKPVQSETVSFSIDESRSYDPASLVFGINEEVRGRQLARENETPTTTTVTQKRRNKSRTKRVEDTWYEQGMQFVEKETTIAIKNVYEGRERLYSGEISVENFVKAHQAHLLDDISLKIKVADFVTFGGVTGLCKGIDWVIDAAATGTRWGVRYVSGNQRLGQNSGDYLYLGLNLLNPARVLEIPLIAGKINQVTKVLKIVQNQVLTSELLAKASRALGPLHLERFAVVGSHIPQEVRAVLQTQYTCKMPSATLPAPVQLNFNVTSSVAATKPTAKAGSALTSNLEPMNVNMNSLKVRNSSTTKGIYDSHEIRSGLEKKYPAQVTSSTVPSPNQPNVKLRGTTHPKTIELDKSQVKDINQHSRAIESYNSRDIRPEDFSKKGRVLKVNIAFDNKGFPIFDDIAKFETRIPREVASSKNSHAHMRAATKNLKIQIQEGKISSNNFTAEQLSDIMSGNRKIDGLTWHHHQDSGRMQLISAEVHAAIGHAGGMNMWPF